MTHLAAHRKKLQSGKRSHQSNRKLPAMRRFSPNEHKILQKGKPKIQKENRRCQRIKKFHRSKFILISSSSRLFFSSNHAIQLSWGRWGVRSRNASAVKLYVIQHYEEDLHWWQWTKVMTPLSPVSSNGHIRGFRGIALLERLNVCVKVQILPWSVVSKLHHLLIVFLSSVVAWISYWS